MGKELTSTWSSPLFSLSPVHQLIQQCLQGKTKKRSLMYQGPVGDVKSHRTLCCVAVRLPRRDWQLRCDGQRVETAARTRQQRKTGVDRNGCTSVKVKNTAAEYLPIKGIKSNDMQYADPCNPECRANRNASALCDVTEGSKLWNNVRS